MMRLFSLHHRYGDQQRHQLSASVIDVINVIIKYVSNTIDLIRLLLSV